MTRSAGIMERLGRLTPAQWYLLAAGWFMVVHAVVDLVLYEQSAAVGSGAVADSHLFLGMFRLNLWHTLAELASAITFLALALSRRWATPGALVNGVGYTALFLSFYVFGSDNLLAEVMVENHATNGFHLVLAVGAFVAVWLTLGDGTSRSGPEGASST